MYNILNIRFNDYCNDGTVDVTLVSGNRWTVQLENGRFNSEMGCLTFINDEEFRGYNDAEGTLDDEKYLAIKVAEGFYDNY